MLIQTANCRSPEAVLTTMVSFYRGGMFSFVSAFLQFLCEVFGYSKSSPGGHRVPALVYTIHTRGSRKWGMVNWFYKRQSLWKWASKTSAIDGKHKIIFPEGSLSQNVGGLMPEWVIFPRETLMSLTFCDWEARPGWDPCEKFLSQSFAFLHIFPNFSLFFLQPNWSQTGPLWSPYGGRFVLRLEEATSANTCKWDSLPFDRSTSFNLLTPCYWSEAHTSRVFRNFSVKKHLRWGLKVIHVPGPGILWPQKT